jgi:hypothetical protein
MRVKAMKAAWCADEAGFRCHYTGVKLDDSHPMNPWFLTFDHTIPGDKDTVVVAASWVNEMKTSLSEAEFWKIIGEYNRYLSEDGEFDKDIIKFEHWRRIYKY